MNYLQHFKSEILPMKEKCFRVANRITGDVSEAEDVVQEVFIKVWNMRDTWSNYANLQGWTMQMTKNKAIDKTRSKHRKTTSLDGVYNMPQTGKSPEQSAVLSDTMQQIKKLMSTLPEKQRNVMQLRDFDQFTYQEIAETLNIPMNHVKVNLSRARKTVRQALIEISSVGN
ncbi:MAG: RNA polymerase sigma factor [Saprospiraceae bacterium]